MRDLADVSMKRQPKSRASFLPSVAGVSTAAVPRAQRAHTFCRHLALAFQIALVSDDDDGKVVLVLDPEYLLLECADFLKRLSRGDAVDEQKAFASAHVLFSHRRVLLLAGGVEDIEEGDFFVNDTLLAVGICEEKLVRCGRE